jgi:hypothetical protein
VDEAGTRAASLALEIRTLQLKTGYWREIAHHFPFGASNTSRHTANDSAAAFNQHAGQQRSQK